MYQLVDYVIEISKVFVTSDRVKLTHQIHSSVPTNIIGDSQRLQQILTNLIHNAIKFTQEGRVELSIHATNTTIDTKSSEGLELEFEVNDTGIGISPEKLNIIFKSFTQSDPSFSKKYGGTGQGLAIAKQLVELMGGQISVTSEVGQGSKFSFKIPVTIPNIPKDLISPTPPTQELKVTQLNVSLRMLIVEDYEENRELTILYLKETNFIIETAEDGEIAYHKYTQMPYDLILMDMRMPNMDGYETTKKIREWEEQNQHKATKIIAVTAYGLDEEKDKSIAVGCDQHLTKPFTRQQLLLTIDKILK